MPKTLRDPHDVHYPPDAMQQRPSLGPLVAEVAARWSVADVQLAMVLCKIMDTPENAGVAMYFSLSGASSQQAVLLAAAESKLDPLKLELFNAIMAEARSVKDERNTIVHGLWGISPRYQNKLVRTEIKEFVRVHSAKRQIHRYGAKSPTELFDVLSLAPHHQLWAAGDFRAVLRRIEAVISRLSAFLLSFEPPARPLLFEPHDAPAPK